ncbi:uncharacterized protein LOC115432674 [Sphaeramia orbicularis]|uniref:uncharacterized protein LOC115432674 n=1 Tax=Sphaeramia orbicularis TaxID=375764 RepID=UPI00117E8EC0|nr:uncharacterized protein LOC115432674 [Sphaeramia orbicularis]
MFTLCLCAEPEGLNTAGAAVDEVWRTFDEMMKKNSSTQRGPDGPGSPGSFHLVPDEVARYQGSGSEPRTWTESDSDSGDSVFITQGPGPASPIDPDHNGDGLQVGLQRTKSLRIWRRPRYRVPRYRFPFLKDWKPGSGTAVTVQQNLDLLYTSFRGFLRSAKETSEGVRTEDEKPTEDEDAVSPLSEEEDMSTQEHVKVVEKKRFAVALKPKRPRLWFHNDSRSRSRRRSRRRRCSEESSPDEEVNRQDWLESEEEERKRRGEEERNDEEHGAEPEEDAPPKKKKKKAAEVVDATDAPLTKNKKKKAADVADAPPKKKKKAADVADSMSGNIKNS